MRDFAGGKLVKEFEGFAEAASLRLQRLQHARSIGDLAMLRGNRLEMLKGDRRGQYSIRINSQWRICFAWPAGADGPSNVEIVDDH